MKNSIRSKFFFLLIGFSLMTLHTIAQGQNGFNIQSRANQNKIVFVPEDSKIKVRLENGNEINGNLSGADSNAIYISRNHSKQKMIPINKINKITVYHPHEYFTLLGGLADGG